MNKKTKMFSVVCALMGLGSFAIADTTVTNSVETYDFMAPFKDYNHKVVISLNNVQTAKKVEIRTNFIPKAGWGSCFGSRVDLLDFATTIDTSIPFNEGQVITTLSRANGGDLDLTKTCDIMGTDSGGATVLEGVVVPIVSGVKIDGKDLEIYRPCANNVCEDPTPGYTNAAYYAQWAVWGRKYNPYDFKYDKLNTIIYAFIGFDKATGNIKTLDASADTWGLSAAARAAKKYPYLNTYLSFGGWTNNGLTTAPMFEMLASDNTRMQNFATQSVALMRKLGFNGIDIDWEWWSDYGNDVAPSKKMLAFFKVLRRELNNAGVHDGKKYHLAIAVNGAASRIAAMEDPNNPNSVPDFWKQTGELMDEINIMSYDYQGGWGTGFPAYFQASTTFPTDTPFKNRVYAAGASPVDAQDNVTDIADSGVTLEQSIGKEGGWSIEGSINAYISAGVPAKKLIVGLPLYARSMQVDSDTDGGLFQTITAPGFGDYGNGVFDYKCLVNPVNDPVNGCGTAKPISGLSDLQFYNISSNADTFNKYGKIAMQPWAYSPSTKTFVTYDDTWSVGEKTKYVMSKSLGGTMFWQADGDSTNSQTSLIDAVVKVYKEYTINISVDNITKTSATISWNKPKLDGAITYRVILNDKVIADNLSSQTYMLSSLDQSTQYNIEVIAIAANESREDNLTFETLGDVVTDETTDTTDETTGNTDETTGTTDETTGTTDETTGNTDETTGNTDETTGNTDETTGNTDETTGNTDETTGNTDETTGNTSSWDSSKVYNDGDKVTINGVIYEAQWWNRGENPTTSGEWGVWRIVGSDSSSETTDSTNTTDETTETEQGTTDTTTNVGDWDSSKVYQADDEVTYEGNKYIAQWWTQGNKPSDGGAWKQPYVSGAEWSTTKDYTGGSIVDYNGTKYKAKWWTRGDIPATNSVWEKI